MSRLIRCCLFAVLLPVMLFLAACDTPPTPAPTLRGALVPTRATPTPTATFTPSPTLTATATRTPTATFTASATFTPSDTPTQTPTDTPTLTSTQTPTFTASPTETELPPQFSATPGPPPTRGFSLSGAVPIAVGDIVTGAIDSSGEVRYVFEAASGDEISVRMEVLDGNLDPFLVLYDAEGNQLAQNDDQDGTTRNSQIGPITLPADGQYLIVATRFQRELGSTIGNFRLTLIAGAPSASGGTPIDEDTVLSYGDSVQAALNSDMWNRTYTFEASEGDVITITMTNVSGTLDPLLQLKNAEGEIVAESDDIASGNRDSEIDAFVIPADGVYTIVASRFMQAEGDSEGEFMLTLDRTQGSGA